ncbi:MAG TPA: histidine-type phosphatase [Polyangia bacterium]|jgi:hypothetical protein
MVQLGFRSTRVLPAVLLAASLVAAAGCGRHGDDGASSAAGDIRLAAAGTDPNLATLSYVISAPGGARLSGTVDVSHSTTVSFVVGGVPAGTGYTIALSGTTVDGATSCAGTSAAFDVAARATTAVSVHLTCHEAPRTGSVLVSGVLNLCPTIDALSASPAEVTVGSALALTAAAHDADAAPAALAYSWTASAGGGAGTIASPAAPSTSFTCTAAGPVTITLAVSDGDAAPGCAASQTLAVDCTAAFRLQATPAELGPGQTATLNLVATDGAAHAGATFTWSDGLNAFQTGVLAPGSITSAPTVAYTPAGCNALTGGDHVLTVVASVADPALAVPGAASTSLTVHCPPAYYTTKTPYQPFQDPATLGAPPAGFAPVFTQIVARHGSRGLSSVKYDAATLAMWQKASADGALTALGAQLGPDVQKIMRANALLGYHVPGISNVGYGNLTQVGINEQKQLAARLLQRLPGYFADVAASAGGVSPRQIVVVSSGMDRAVDSAAFFSGAIGASSPALASLIVPAPALTAYPASAPVAQPAGFNHFLLYFHKLTAKADLVTSPADPYFQTYQDSLAYQAFASDADMTAKVAAILADPSIKTAARAVLESLFDRTFVDKIDTGVYTFSNAGSFTFTSDDGLLTTTVTGDGKTTVKSLADAASMLYNLYVISPAMAGEAGVDFTRYVPTAQAQVLAYLQDAQDFYQMGPSITEKSPITFKMAQALEDDFFTEIDAIAAGNLAHAAKLRFTHAEIVTPFANLLGLDGAATPTPLASTYTYASNPWRGQVVASMATNQQWDVFRDGGGTLLVRLLYDEKEIDFKPSCAAARFRPGTHFYEYNALKACYGR